MQPLQEVTRSVSERWRKVRLPGVDGDVDAWQRDGYTLCLNINKGHEVRTGKRDRNGHHWWFEVTNDKDEPVGEAPDLKGAKQVAREDQKKHGTDD